MEEILDLNEGSDVRYFLKICKKIYESKKVKCYNPIEDDDDEIKFEFTSKRTKRDKFDLLICLDIVDNNKILLISMSSKNGHCLRMKFEGLKKHSRLFGFKSFKKSIISQISRDKCGYDNKNKSVTLNGRYILNFANRLNEIFEVDVSELEDDSKIKVCDNYISLKLLSLLKYGKTWYEREVGFKLDDKEIYKIAEKVGEMTVKKVYDVLEEIDNDMSKNKEIELKLKKLTKNNIEKVDKILKKISEGKNSKIRTIFVKAFRKDSGLNECEQQFLWDHIIKLNPREYLNKSGEERNKFMKDYYKFASEAYVFSLSRKVKK